MGEVNYIDRGYTPLTLHHTVLTTHHLALKTILEKVSGQHKVVAALRVSFLQSTKIE